MPPSLSLGGGKGVHVVVVVVHTYGPDCGCASPGEVNVLNELGLRVVNFLFMMFLSWYAQTYLS